MLSLTIFLMMVLVFTASFPLVSSQAQASDNSAQAAMVIQHKMDQMRSVGFGGQGGLSEGLSSPGALEMSGDIDPYTGSSTSVPYTVTFTGVDNLAATGGPGSGYFPAGTTGTITVQDLHTIQVQAGVQASLLVPAGCIDEVTVTITWPAGGAGGQNGGSCSTSTLISQQGEVTKI